LRDLQINRHTAKRGTPIGMRSMFGALMRGRMLLNQDPIAGSGLLRSALADLRGTPSDVRFQLYLVWLAETLGAAGPSKERSLR
jgi:hypothetical protein